VNLNAASLRSARSATAIAISAVGTLRLDKIGQRRKAVVMSDEHPGYCEVFFRSRTGAIYSSNRAIKPPAHLKHRGGA